MIGHDKCSCGIGLRISVSKDHDNEGLVINIVIYFGYVLAMAFTNSPHLRHCYTI